MSANRLLGLRCKGSKIFWIEQIYAKKNKGSLLGAYPKCKGKGTEHPRRTKNNRLGEVTPRSGQVGERLRIWLAEVTARSRQVGGRLGEVARRCIDWYATIGCIDRGVTSPRYLSTLLSAPLSHSSLRTYSVG